MHSSCYCGFSAPAKDFLQHTTLDQNLDISRPYLYSIRACIICILQDKGEWLGVATLLTRESRLVAVDPACRPSVYKCWAVWTAWANRMLPEVLSQRWHTICPTTIQRTKCAFTWFQSYGRWVLHMALPDFKWTNWTLLPWAPVRFVCASLTGCWISLWDRTLLFRLLKAFGSEVVLVKMVHSDIAILTTRHKSSAVSEPR